MKQEEEPWIDHLKQRVNEYEKPLPENDWNHFQTKYFTPYLHKKKRIRTMRIAAVLLLLFIPFATTFYFLQTEKHKVASPVVSLPKHTSQEALQAILPLCLKTNYYRTGPNQRQLP
ncbi:hypothetical protein NXX77_18845 [Phocaeicola dorei]|nr:hypothetical protein [Phocaeicola dorei]